MNNSICGNDHSTIWRSGRDIERARIVAYLRTPVVWTGPVSDDEDGHRVFMERALRFAADAIEAGDYE